MPSANNSLPQPAYIPGSMARSEGATGPRSHAAVEGGDQLTPRAHGARLHHTAMDQSGAIANFGDAPFLGAPTGRDVSGIAIAPSKKGYWVATSAGNVFGYGNVHTYGGPEGRIGGALVTGIASTPDGSGYWVVTSAGSVFTYGDAKFFGSLGTSHLTSPVVGITSAPRGRGYWLVTSQGAVYAFGAARFFGPDKQPDFPSPVIGMAVTANGTGYWLATSAGDVYSFGGARFFGSLGDQKTEVSAIAATPDGRGYYLLTASGHVHAFGAAAALGSPVLASSSTAATSLATTSDGKGYVVATGGGSLVAGLRHGVMQRAAQRAQPPSSSATSTYLGTFMVTCYDLGGVTASGRPVGPSSVAVDPSVIPLGSRIYIDGAGLRVADDTGGAIIGDHVDIWEPTYWQCAEWGVRERSVYRVAG